MSKFKGTKGKWEVSGENKTFVYALNEKGTNSFSLVMANCKACGGILGLDCFNESYCLQISYNNYHYQDDEINNLREQVEVLKYQFSQNNIHFFEGLNVPYPTPFLKPIEIEKKTELYDYDYPF